MATAIKGIYKSFKSITQIFAGKECEIDIGYPTDVKHVTHIGWDGTSGSPPSWMTEFKTGPQFSGLSLGPGRGGETSNNNSMEFLSCSSQDFDDSTRGSQAGSTPKSLQPTDLPSIPKKHKRRKSKTTPPTSSSSKPAKSKASKDKKSILNII